MRLISKKMISFLFLLSAITSVKAGLPERYVAQIDVKNHSPQTALTERLSKEMIEGISKLEEVAMVDYNLSDILYSHHLKSPHPELFFSLRWPGYPRI